MLDILRSLIDIIGTLFEFIGQSITSLITFITHIPVYINVLTASIGYLPSVLIPFAIASISLYFVLFVIDRR